MIPDSADNDIRPVPRETDNRREATATTESDWKPANADVSADSHTMANGNEHWKVYKKADLPVIRPK